MSEAIKIKLLFLILAESVLDAFCGLVRLEVALNSAL